MRTMATVNINPAPDMADVGLGVIIILWFRSGRPKCISKGNMAQDRKARANTREKREMGFRL